MTTNNIKDWGTKRILSETIITYILLPSIPSGGHRNASQGGLRLSEFQSGDDEVSFDPDGIIENIEQVDEGWWIGEVNGQRGLFPSNYTSNISRSGERCCIKINVLCTKF